MIYLGHGSIVMTKSVCHFNNYNVAVERTYTIPNSRYVVCKYLLCIMLAKKMYPCKSKGTFLGYIFQILVNNHIHLKISIIYPFLVKIS